MEIFDGSIESQNYFEKAVTEKDIELEIIFGSKVSKNPITRKVFLRLIDRCKQVYESLPVTTDLDIRYDFRGNPSNVRCTIHGMDFIKEYCKSDSLEQISPDQVEFMIKKYYKDPNEPTKKFFPLKDENYNVRLNLKMEEPLLRSHHLVDDFFKDFTEKKKHFRFKKRYSYLTKDKLYRIDLSVVKSTKYFRGKHQFETKFQKANILKNREEYEVEIEYLGWKKEVGIPKIDVLSQKIRQGHILTRGKGGNIYDPLNLGIPFFEREQDSEDVLEERPDYEYDSPRFDPLKEYKPYTVSSLKYSQDEYRKLIGKFTKVSDNYFDENNIDIRIRDSLKEYYKRGKNVTIIHTIYERLDDSGDFVKTIAEVHLSHQMGEYSKLHVPLQYLYSEYFTIEEERIIESGLSEDDISKKLLQKYPDHMNNIEDIGMEDLIHSIMELMTNHVIYLSEIIYNTYKLIPYNLLESVIDGYVQLTGQKTKRFNFVGPQPVTLNIDDIQEKNPKSILVDYAVTEKADGERYELYIKDGRGYLINAMKDVIDIGITFTNINDEWLFDGEYITKNKYNEDVRLFMVFDVYYCGTLTPQPIHTYPFIARDPSDISRQSIISDFFSKKDTFIYDKESIELDVKMYEIGYLSDTKKTSKNKLNIFSASKKLLLKEKEGHYPYEIDGLIYLPVRLSVKGSIEGCQSKHIGGTWNENFKWKPERLNTIDFLVKIKKTMKQSKVVDEIFPIVHTNAEGVKEITEYKQLELYVGYKEEDDDTINFCMKVLDEKKRKDISLYEHKKFNFHLPEDKYDYTNIILQDGKMLCENGDEIKDNDIVELKYQKDSEDSLHWVPLRVRSDKQKPQYVVVANNVWDTILHPITDEMIQGKKELRKMINIEKDDGKYYINNTEDCFESEKLKQLHNYVKSKLIGGITSSFNGPIKILDLSIGRGGDVNKFKNYSFLLGIDIASNIHEACKRFYFNKSTNKGAFIRADTSKNIKSGEACSFDGNDESDRKHGDTMITILYDHKKPIPSEYNSINYRYRGLAKNGFDVVSSQFSMHYYFKNEKTLNGFVQNLKDNVNVGGYFIGTCYNGMNIFNHFLDTETEKLEYKEDTGKLVYSIEKKYEIDSFEYNSEKPENMLGNVITVYMESIGQEIDEYLVNFDHFKDIMETNGFQLTIPTDIESKYSHIFRNDYFQDGLGQFRTVIERIPEIDQSDNDFGKYYSEARGMNQENSKELQLLSGFNTYFIFKKMV